MNSSVMTLVKCIYKPFYKIITFEVHSCSFVLLSTWWWASVSQSLFPCSLGLIVSHYLVLFTLFFCVSSVSFCSKRFVSPDAHLCLHKELGQQESAALHAQFSKILIKKELSSTYCPLITSDCAIESHCSSKWVIMLMNPLEQSLSNFSKCNFPFQLQTQALLQKFSVTVYCQHRQPKMEILNLVSFQTFAHSQTHTKKKHFKEHWTLPCVTQKKEMCNASEQHVHE